MHPTKGRGNLSTSYGNLMYIDTPSRTLSFVIFYFICPKKNEISYSTILLPGLGWHRHAEEQLTGS